MTFDKLMKEYKEEETEFKSILDKGIELMNEYIELERSFADEHKTKRKMEINIRPYLNKRKTILEKINPIIDQKYEAQKNLARITEGAIDNIDVSQEQEQCLVSNVLEWIPKLEQFNEMVQLLDELSDMAANYLSSQKIFQNIFEAYTNE